MIAHAVTAALLITSAAAEQLHGPFATNRTTIPVTANDKSATTRGAHQHRQQPTTPTTTAATTTQKPTMPQRPERLCNSAINNGVAVLVFAAWEWSALAGENRSRYRLGFTALVGLLMFGVWWALVRLESAVPAGLMQLVLGVAVLVWLMLLGVVLQYPSGWQWLRTVRVQLLLGLVVLLFGAAGFTVLSVNPLAKFWIVYVVAIVVIADVGAYFSGKAFGRRKLASQVSPGKTWEGF